MQQVYSVQSKIITDWNYSTSLLHVPGSRDTGPVQVVPLNDQCNKSWFCPSPKTSSCPALEDTAAGAAPVSKVPPSDTGPCQLVPSNHLCNNTFSSPSPKTSRRPGPKDTT